MHLANILTKNDQILYSLFLVFLESFFSVATLNILMKSQEIDINQRGLFFAKPQRNSNFISLGLVSDTLNCYFLIRNGILIIYGICVGD